MRPDRCPVAVLLGRRCGATAPRQSRSARARVFATGQGRKTDATDAHSVALVGTRMSGLRPVVDDAQLAVLRVLVDRRRSLGDDHCGGHGGRAAGAGGLRVRPLPLRYADTETGAGSIT